MSRASSRSVFAIVAVTTPASTQLAVETIGAEPPLQSPLGATVGGLKNLRLVRPLSRNEEIALRPLDQFNECELCPEMLVGPAVSS